MAKRLAALAALVFLSSAHPFAVGAGTLGPTKPSEVIVVRGDETADECGNFATMRHISSWSLPDGMTTSFVIPPKSVFVVTSFEWFTEQGAANVRSIADLFVVDASGVFASVLSQGGGLADAQGSADGTVAISPGVVVKAGAQLCVSALNSPPHFGATVHGFITKDK